MLALSIMAAHAMIHAFAGQSKGAQESTAQTIIPMDPTRMFAYDNKIPMSVSETGSEKRGDVTIHDITFVGIQNRIKAYLVTPAGKGPFAGILFVHWLGDPNTTNRTEFLSEAISFASEGTVCLLIDAMWAKPGWYGQRIPEEDYLNSIRQVVELRRAMDLLLDRPGVDPKRIAYVGHDFGAMYGAVMGSVDGRAKTYVFMAGIPHLVDWYLFARQPKSPDTYRKQIAVLDPANYIKNIKSASFLFQFANVDKYVPAAAAAEFYSGANPRKVMATYDADHSMKSREVQEDRVQWLERELGLKKR
jgi:cephalosporin-C deacetylase-like acetyl esterase